MIVIIGAGIAGLSLGWKLASAGADVAILEKGKVASGASGASGAYLEPRPGRGKLRALEWASLDLWPEFADKLERESDIDIGYCRDGVTHIGFPGNLEKLKQALELHRASNWQIEWLEGDKLRQFEPALSDEVIAGFHLPQVHHIDARKTCHALAIAFQRQGGRLIENCAIGKVNNCHSGIDVITADGGKHHADSLVIAAGFGANTISGLPDDIPLSRPVRGVMVELEQPSGRLLLRHPLKRPDGVLLPLVNGNLLVGSSHEEGESTLEAPVQIVERMLASATRVVPEIAELDLIGYRVGIRALVGDGLLRLGRSAENRNIYYSLSHAGAGFLRAPLIAKELANAILNTDTQPEWIAPFYKA